MGYTLTTGLSDLSKELGETTTNSTSRRIGHYNDAVVHFANDRKWPFLVKKNTDDTTDGNSNNEYPLTGITDIRMPGGIKEITLGTSTTAYLPINWDRRSDPRYAGGKYFYILPDESAFRFIADVGTGDTINIWHYYIPARITDSESVSEFPIPDRYRKIVAVLGAAFVQWARYLEAPGNRLFNLYQSLVKDAVGQQSEQSSRKPRSLTSYPQYKGFKRRYP